MRTMFSGRRLGGKRVCSAEACRSEQAARVKLRRQQSERARDTRKRAKWQRRSVRIPRHPDYKGRIAIFNRDGWRCYLCGDAVTLPTRAHSPKQATEDHVIPRSKGGHPTDPANLRTACHECNSRKRDLLLECA